MIDIKLSLDGATMASGSNHLITAYYSFIDPERMTGCSGRFTHINGYPSAAGQVQAR